MPILLHKESGYAPFLWKSYYRTGTGELASHLVGKGRMEEPEVIIQHLANYFAGKEGDLRGKTIMITAGPTWRENRSGTFYRNYSSGKMGFAIADECAARGAKVIMISGPVQQQLKYPVRWFRGIGRSDV